MSLRTSPLPFGRRVEKALGDGQLRLALTRATGRFTELRDGAFAALPQADSLRDRARVVRAETLARLDEHLAAFAGAAEAAGARVHWADDASAAREAVLAIARENGVRTVVKAKSMVAEEVGLNPALEAAGLEVVESDLGEYIIQLAGEPPSHIIAPAFHKTKEQVGRLLHERLGVPLTSDPAEMAAVARDRLRHVYLEAGLGVSGVNFGVASTGSLAIVSNEGNASLSTTVPPVHVALMGIERVVRDLGDLALMLRILARSATGQKLSVYTDLVTGPRRGGDRHGPRRLHIVVVDNGRSGLLGTELEEILYCIRCGACLSACPVYRTIGGHAYGSVYSGPVGAVLTPGLDGRGPWRDLPQASTLCGACREVCPVRIDIPRMLVTLRAREHASGGGEPWVRAGLRVYRLMAVRPRLFHAARRAAARVSRLLRGPGWSHRMPWPLSAWTAHREFPPLSTAARPAEGAARTGP
ncbi:MAG TPA: lactate utilization protein B [Vicinamibacteria bacterium]|nr:lactate utilization protein B [Vicinamibacteria bacterium]